MVADVGGPWAGGGSGIDLPIGVGGHVGLTGYSYAAQTTYTSWGQVGQEQLGSTTTNAYITNTYDPHTGALTDTNLKNTSVSSTAIDDTAYTHDPAGNPTSQTETRQGTTSETQCFAYDTLDRLQQAWTATDNCAASPSTTAGSANVGDGITGSAYWTSWAFDALGQRTTQTDHNPSGGADTTTTTYTYNGNGSAQPHVLASTSTLTGTSTTGSSNYTYDQAGNTLTRNITNGTTTTQQTLGWDDQGQLSTVTTAAGGVSYLYGPSGDLLLQKDASAATNTLYLPGEQLLLHTGTGTITGTRFYPLPGGGEAVRTGTGTNYTFEIGDPHSTATLTIDPTFTTPTWRQQTPYGAPRGTAPATWPDNHGFLNKVQDTTTGLTDIGARWYDPALGRFASLDPLFETTDPQQHNGYTYAAGNPITRSDPSGLLCRPQDCSYPPVGSPDPSQQNQGYGDHGCAYWTVAGCGTGDLSNPGNHPLLGHSAPPATIKLLQTYGYGGSPLLTLNEALQWLTTATSGRNQDFAWDFICRMLNLSDSKCSNNPLNGDNLNPSAKDMLKAGGLGVVTGLAAGGVLFIGAIAAGGATEGIEGCLSVPFLCRAALANGGKWVGGAILAGAGGEGIPDAPGCPPSGECKGAIPDKAPQDYYDQLAMQGAKSPGAGTVVMRNLGDAPRLVANYGPGEWVKMQSTLDDASGKAIRTVHWFRNLDSGMDVEFKFKLDYPQMGPNVR